MEHGADHIESDSPSEHGGETPRPRTRSPSVSTTVDYRSLPARTTTTQPGQPNLLDDADATSWTTPFYALPRRASSSASRPGTYYHRDHNSSRVERHRTRPGRRHRMAQGHMHARVPRSHSPELLPFPSFTGRSQSGWRFLPFTIDGIPVFKILSDGSDDSDEEFHIAARHHRFDQLMLRQGAQTRFWRSVALRPVRAEEPRTPAVEEIPQRCSKHRYKEACSVSPAIGPLASLHATESIDGSVNRPGHSPSFSFSRWA